MWNVRRVAGFTLTEVLVVVAILSVLAAVMYPNFNDSRMKSRDGKRQTDLQTLQIAIETYKNKYGRYPEGCAGANNWSKETACPTNYIKGGSVNGVEHLFSEFVVNLPRDPKLNPSASNGSGYMYVTNAEGSVYKLVAKSTVESETVGFTHPMRHCDSSNAALDWDTGVLCNNDANNGNTQTAWCKPGAGAPSADNLIFRTSYGVWGGFANPANPNGTAAQIAASVKLLTQAIICKKPG